MTVFSEEWALEQKLKHDKWRKGKPTNILDVDTNDEKESVLQGKIMKWARDHGYPCQCFKMSKQAKGFLVPGWWD